MEKNSHLTFGELLGLVIVFVFAIFVIVTPFFRPYQPKSVATTDFEICPEPECK